MDGKWQSDLERWLAPFVAALRHKTRARMCPAYVAGLIGPGDRKSVQPIAARTGNVSYDQLHHFVASGVWNATPLEAALLAEADRSHQGAGRRKVGTTRRYYADISKMTASSASRQCSKSGFATSRPERRFGTAGASIPDA